MQVEWLTIDAAVQRLGLSKRRVQELATPRGGGKLRSKRDFDDKGHIATFISAGDVERLVTERSGPREPRENENAISQFRSTAGIIAAQNALATLDTRQVERKTRFLTIKEAAQESGLPESFISNLILRKQLKAFDVGPRPGGRWRISRAALDSIEA